MAVPCRVCSHPKRHEIDLRLSVQVVNCRAVAQEFGVAYESVTRHRRKHLDGFLQAFTAQVEALPAGTIRAEAQRLYLTTLDALAQAQAGVLTHLEEDSSGVVRTQRTVSHSTVVRLIRESRQGLTLLATLAAASGEADIAPAGVNKELDERIAAALDRVSSRMLTTGGAGPTDVTDAEILEEASVVDRDGGEGGSAARIALADDQGAGGRWSGQGPPASRAAEGVPDSEGPPAALLEGIAQAARGELVDRGSFVDPPALESPAGSQTRAEYTSPRVLELAQRLADPLLTEVARAAIVSEIVELSRPVKAPIWTGNPAASEEERRAAGFGVLPVNSPRHPSE